MCFVPDFLCILGVDARAEGGEYLLYWDEAEWWSEPLFVSKGISRTAVRDKGLCPLTLQAFEKA